MNNLSQSIAGSISSNEAPDILDNLMKEMGEKIVKGIYISVVVNENYDTEPLENWLKQQILAWHETEKRKYAMAYADEIIGESVWKVDDDLNALCSGLPVTSGVIKKDMRLRDELHKLNKDKGGKI